jgi:hypothetical protein
MIHAFKNHAACGIHQQNDATTASWLGDKKFMLTAAAQQHCLPYAVPCDHGRCELKRLQGSMARNSVCLVGKLNIGNVNFTAASCSSWLQQHQQQRRQQALQTDCGVDTAAMQRGDKGLRTGSERSDRCCTMTSEKKPDAADMCTAMKHVFKCLLVSMRQAACEQASYTRRQTTCLFSFRSILRTSTATTHHPPRGCTAVCECEHLEACFIRCTHGGLHTAIGLQANKQAGRWVGKQASHCSMHKGREAVAGCCTKIACAVLS